MSAAQSPRDLKEQIAKAVADGSVGRDELLATLNGLSNADIVRLSPNVWAKLGAVRTAAFLATRSGQPARPRLAGTELEEPEVLAWRDRHAAKIFKVAYAWDSLPALLQGAMSAIAVTIVAAPLATIAVVATPSVAALASRGNSMDWTHCARLDHHVDHCVYDVRRALSLQDAASYAGLPVDALKAANPTLSLGYALPRGTRIVISRPLSR